MPPKYDAIKCYKVNAHPQVLHDKLRNHSKDFLVKFLMGFFLLYIAQDIIPEMIGMALPTTIADVIANVDKSIDSVLLQRMPRMAVASYFYALLFNGVFNLGEALYCLTALRSREADYRALFEGFTYYFKALGLFLAQTALIAVWSMCFLIPGIIAALNYSQSFFILADDPDKNIFVCMAESKLRMRGNRRMFIGYLISFIPYILAGALPALLAGIFINIDTTSVKYTLISLALDAPLFCALGYVSLGRCTFYELLITGGFANFKYKQQDVFREPIDNYTDNSQEN